MVHAGTPRLRDAKSPGRSARSCRSSSRLTPPVCSDKRARMGNIKMAHIASDGSQCGRPSSIEFVSPKSETMSTNAGSTPAPTFGPPAHCETRVGHIKLDVTGLDLVAVFHPNCRELARALTLLLDQGLRIAGASDDAVSEATYLRCPAGTRTGIDHDRPISGLRGGPAGELQSMIKRFDLDCLLSALNR